LVDNTANLLYNRDIATKEQMMTVFIVTMDRVIYAVFDSRAKAKAYIKEVFVESQQHLAHIQEERVL
jgi:hypothetical protein